MSKYTAIVRKKPSLPMRWLEEEGLLRGRILDYGCGRGFDMKWYDIDGYDLHWGPLEIKGKFDTITCNFVLNVVTREEQKEIIKIIKSLLKPDGAAYFTVRRDLEKDRPGRGCIQRSVILDLISLKKTSGLEIYALLN